MIVTTEYVSIPVAGSQMRTFIAAPKKEGKYPGILFYSDIFQLTGPMLRSSVRLASYGFVVAAPEIYHRILPAGTVIPFDDEGRDRGMAGATPTAVAEFFGGGGWVLGYLDQNPGVEKGKIR